MCWTVIFIPTLKNIEMILKKGAGSFYFSLIWDAVKNKARNSSIFLVCTLL